MESQSSKLKNIYPKVSAFDIFKVYWKSAKKYFVYGFIVFVGLSCGTMLQGVLVPTFYKKFFEKLYYKNKIGDKISSPTNNINFVEACYQSIQQAASFSPYNCNFPVLIFVITDF